MLGTNPKSGRWRGWRLPENILVPKGEHHPFTYCPSPKSRSPTVGTTPTQQHREKELGGGPPKITGPWDPVGGRIHPAPSHTVAVLPQRQQYSIHWPFWPPIPNSQDQGSQRTSDLPQSHPNSTFRTSLERMPGGSNREQPPTFPLTQGEEQWELPQRSQARSTNHWAVLAPQLGTHPTPYLLPKCSQEPCFFASLFLKLHTHTPLRGSQGREGSEEAWLSVTTPSVCVLLMGPFHPFHAS